MAPFWLAALVLACGVGLTLIGAVAAWAGANLVKRLAGVLIGFIGALLAMAALGAPAPFLAAGVALMFAHAGLGLALIVRLQETYGGVESTEIDAEDRKAEASERAP